MNFRLVGRAVGKVYLIMAACMAVSLLLAILYGEPVLPFLYTIVLCIVIGLPLSVIRTRKKPFLAREAFVTVVFIWLMVSFIGAFPYYFSDHFSSYIDCLFESVSGFTTTGATVIGDVEAVPNSLLFWRSSTQFFGGMGVLVLTTALMTTAEERFQHLTRAEIPGPTADKLAPKLIQSSRILYKIYLLLTLANFMALLLSGLGFFDAAVMAMSTAGTGGFSVRNGSIAAYANPAAEMVTAVFMLLFSISFTVYYLIRMKRFRKVLSVEELRVFLCIVGAVTVMIFVNTLSAAPTWGTALRDSFFTVTSVISTTGFIAEDYALWPQFSQALIVILIMVGASAGSTAGGIKVARVIMMFKGIKREIIHTVHPNAVKVVTVGGRVMNDATVRSVNKFIALYFIIAFGITLVISLDGNSFATNLTAAFACLSNVGPGLEGVSPANTYNCFSGLSKCVLSLGMIVGRLEIYPILIFFSPYTWRKG